MTHRAGVLRAGRFLRGAAAASLCAIAACGSSQTTSDGGGPGGGSCGVGVAQGQACNTVTDVGTVVTPTCMSGTIPAGTGGTIVDGTYTLTSQTYYGSTTCSYGSLSGTVEITGGCIQQASSTPIPVAISTTYSTAGAMITRTVTCIGTGGLDASAASLDTPTSTFTATPTTVTIFIKNSGTSSSNPDRVETYQKH
jgi:hypothetical protein